MFTMIRILPLRQLVLEQIPAIVLALVVAETFYKFHSFTLECIAFLTTWLVLDGVFHLIATGVERLLARGNTSSRSHDGT